MVKRLLDCNASDFKTMNKDDLIEAIKASEARTICSEMIVALPSIGGNLTHAEVARAAGADLMLLNGIDVFEPRIWGLDVKENPIQRLKELVGRPIGCNLEPVDLKGTMMEERLEISAGRVCTEASVKQAQAMGMDFICLTGNPATGVSTHQIAESLVMARQHFDGLIIAGKMHSSGTDEPVVSLEVIETFIEAGADIILVPAVGTVPGVTDSMVRDIVARVHQAGKLVMSTIGTSQESAQRSVIEAIGLRNKINGVDIQHIGDAGYGGMGNIENIITLSMTIRGGRHTIHQMSASVNR